MKYNLINKGYNNPNELLKIVSILCILNTFQQCDLKFGAKGDDWKTSTVLDLFLDNQKL